MRCGWCVLGGGYCGVVGIIWCIDIGFYVWFRWWLDYCGWWVCMDDLIFCGGLLDLIYVRRVFLVGERIGLVLFGVFIVGYQWLFCYGFFFFWNDCC